MVRCDMVFEHLDDPVSRRADLPIHVGSYKETVLEGQTRTKPERVAQTLGTSTIRRDIAKSADHAMMACWCEILVRCEMHRHHSGWKY